MLLTLGTKKKEKKNSGPSVGNTFLSENYIRASVNLAAIKCHVHSLAPENNQKIELINRCNVMGVNLAEIRGLQQKIATKGTDNITEIAIAGNLAIFAEFKKEIENLGLFEWEKRCVFRSCMRTDFPLCGQCPEAMFKDDYLKTVEIGGSNLLALRQF